MDKYYANTDNLKQIIEQYGFAIIPNVLNQDECLNMINNMWDYLEHITNNWKLPITRDNDKSWYQIQYLTYGSTIFQFWNIGHSQLCWNVRQNPKIVNIFAKFWNVQDTDLLASFDGASILFPSEITDFGWDHDINPWFHTDQSYIDSSFKNIQSWVTAYDVTEDDATLVVLEGSHKYHEVFAKKFNITDPRNFYQLNEEELMDYLLKFQVKKITCPKGSLVIWDSRTIHYASGNLKCRAKPNTRCITYLCYAPKSFIDQDNLINKKLAFDNLNTTSHDPCLIRVKPYKIYDLKFEDYIEFKFQNINKINKPIITDLGLSLTGHDI